MFMSSSRNPHPLNIVSHAPLLCFVFKLPLKQRQASYATWVFFKKKKKSPAAPVPTSAASEGRSNWASWPNRHRRPAPLLFPPPRISRQREFRLLPFHFKDEGRCSRSSFMERHIVRTPAVSLSEALRRQAGLCLMRSSLICASQEGRLPSKSWTKTRDVI